MRLALLFGLSAVATLPSASTPQAPEALIWPAGPLEVRIALGEPLGPTLIEQITGEPIVFGLPRQLADPRKVQGVLTTELGTLSVAGVRVEDGGRTLILPTDPHPTEATYRLKLPGELGTLAYDLSGVETSWTPAEGLEPAWSGWLPDLNLQEARSSTEASLEHDRLFARFEEEGSLVLRTLLALPEGEVSVSIQADRPFEAEIAYEPLEIDSIADPLVRETYGATGIAESFGEPVELYLTVPTGPGFEHKIPVIKTMIETAEGNRWVLRSEQILPWSPPPMASTAEAIPDLPSQLRGGDATRGEAVFFGTKGKCADCHQVGDRGRNVGPALTDIANRLSPAAIYQSIEAPSAAIAPEYLPYTIITFDGRVVVGVVRAAGEDQVQVTDAEANQVMILRSDIDQIQPISTSIMPVGLVGAIGEADLRDLIAYLSKARSD